MMCHYANPKWVIIQSQHSLCSGRSANSTFDTINLGEDRSQRGLERRRGVVVLARWRNDQHPRLAAVGQARPHGSATGTSATHRERAWVTLRCHKLW